MCLIIVIFEDFSTLSFLLSHYNHTLTHFLYFNLLLVIFDHWVKTDVIAEEKVVFRNHPRSWLFMIKKTETLKIRICGKIENLEFFKSKMWQVNLWLNYSSKHIGLVLSLRSYKTNIITFQSFFNILYVVIYQSFYLRIDLKWFNWAFLYTISVSEFIWAFSKAKLHFSCSFLKNFEEVITEFNLTTTQE